MCATAWRLGYLRGEVYNMDAALTAVVGQLTTAAGSLTTNIPLVAGIGIGVGLLGFGIRYLVHTFKSTAH